MATQPLIPQQTGNPLVDNPQLKAAFIAHMAQQTAQPQMPAMPAGGATPQHAPPIMGTQAPQLGALRKPPEQEPAGSVSMPPAGAPSMPSASSPRMIAPLGTVEGDEAHRGQLLDQGSGISRIAHNIEGTQFGQNHPVLGKIAGVGLQGLATLGDIGLSLAAPRAEAMVPGTAGYHAAQVRNAGGQLAEDEANRAHEAATASSQSELPLRQAQTEHERAATAALQNPQPAPKEEHWTVTPEYTGPNGEPVEVEQNSGELRVAGQSGAKRVTKEGKEETPQQQTYDDLIKGGMSPIQAYEKIREKPAGAAANTGTWQLQEDANGKPALFNSKTGEMKAAPTGLAKSGTFDKEQKATEPARQALAYAKEYGDRDTHTGPGDEALMEKFFELAKPSSGFRMSQMQIDMLKNAQSWMNGLEAHLRHATTGTWFSDEQRKQIIDTMTQLSDAKQPAAAPQGNQPPAGGKAGDPLGLH